MTGAMFAVTRLCATSLEAIDAAAGDEAPKSGFFRRASTTAAARDAAALSEQNRALFAHGLVDGSKVHRGDPNFDKETDF